MKTPAHVAGDDVCQSEIYRPFPPAATVKCMGLALYRSQAARDFACLLDFDPSVIAWRSTPLMIAFEDDAGNEFRHYLDFAIERTSERLLVEVVERDTGALFGIENAAARMGYRYQRVSAQEFSRSVRLQNARDLLRYGGWTASMGDRVRILAALDDLGSLTLAECLGIVREGRPMETVVALFLKGFVDVDLDQALFGPDTVVRRKREGGR